MKTYGIWVLLNQILYKIQQFSYTYVFLKYF